MRITIRNNAGLKKSYIRFIKWKLYQIKEKFQHLIYVEVFLNSEGQSPKTYIANIRLGITGHDIIIQGKSENLNELLQKSNKAIHRYLAKNKTKKKNEIFHKKAYQTW